MEGLEEQVAARVNARDGQVHTVRLYSSSLDYLLLEAVDEALTDILGTRAREAIYDYLERNRGLAREEIPKRLNDFQEFMDEAFGKGGQTIGRMVAKRLYAHLDWEFVDIPQYTLPDYLQLVADRVEREIKAQIRSFR